MLALLCFTLWMTEEGAGGVDLAASSLAITETVAVVCASSGTCAASLRLRCGRCSTSVPHPYISRCGVDGEAQGVEMGRDGELEAGLLDLR
jgi:hypothetical protein